MTLFFLQVASIPQMILERLGIICKVNKFDLIPDYFVNTTDIFFASFLIPLMAGLLE
ncbi:hypothetical protein [Sunxiuqinia sp. sy24]|uniref:hypothetical protein n=1 Tax=Sunxiuqinia sp. sy24 TaxID=3461495 RepID=UPI0040455F99